MPLLKDLLLVDNYDSFTHILAHCLRAAGAKVDVVRNDAIGLAEARPYRRVVISPGPGIPAQAGITPELIEDRMGKVPILGVCLGHQALGEALGGRLYLLPEVRHGRQGRLDIEREGTLLSGLRTEVVHVGLYHSWAIDPHSLHAQVLATDADGVLMAFEDVQRGVFAVQFHPESILSSHGMALLYNFTAMR
ncbi:aminodeoxychorismate/anthranilate synthase component II [bacterium]|nr:aminodeoxychorismate/anthranilate synthase component II [bacterium]